MEAELSARSTGAIASTAMRLILPYLAATDFIVDKLKVAADAIDGKFFLSLLFSRVFANYIRE